MCIHLYIIYGCRKTVVENDNGSTLENVIRKYNAKDCYIS